MQSLDGLSLLTESKKRLNDDQWDEILNTVIQSIGRTTGPDAGDTGSSLLTGEEKLVCMSVIHLFATTARSNVGLDDEIERINQILTDCGVEKERRQKLVVTYSNQRDQLIKRLDRLGISSTRDEVPTFKNVTWCRETTVASSDLNQMPDPLTQFLISVKHESGSIDMTTDSDDLQEMVHSIRECCKVIESIKHDRKSKK